MNTKLKNYLERSAIENSGPFFYIRYLERISIKFLILILIMILVGLTAYFVFFLFYK